MEQKQQLPHATLEQLHMFWNYQREEMEHTLEFKNHQLPLARIKKIMKADEDVRMISAEAPVLFSKACELFILELTIRSWLHAEENKRRTLQKNDIAAAIARTEIFDFLVDIVPPEEAKEVDAGPREVAGVPCYYSAVGAWVGQPAGMGWWGEEVGSGVYGGVEAGQGYGVADNSAPPPG